MSARDHEDYREEVGAYLLGSLSDLERQAFESHLEACAECREGVERLRPAAEALPRSVEPLAPPPGLKSALMEKVREEGGELERPSLRERLGGLAAPLRLRPGLAATAAVALLAVGLLTGLGVAQLLSGPDARTISANADPTQVPRAGGSLVVSGDGEDGAILRVNGLSPLGRDRVYQAWIQRKGGITPQPTFEVGDDGRGAVAVPEDLSDADAVLITREPRGGSRVPSETPILRVTL